MRRAGRGPPYIRIGTAIRYRRSDLTSGAKEQPARLAKRFVRRASSGSLKYNRGVFT